MLRKIALFLSILFSLTASAFEQQFWDKQDFHRWSKQDCAKLLSNSPWSQRSDQANVVFAPVSSGNNNSSGQSTPDTEATSGRAASTALNYVLQMRSATPVRQAVARQQMLAVNYDNLSAAQKKQVDTQVEKFLSTPMSDVVVVHVLYGSNVVSWDRELARFWQQQTLDKLKDSFYLIGGKGQRIAPVDFEALPGAGREFEVTFPRKSPEGEPVAGPADKLLAIEFVKPEIGSWRSEKAYVPFKIKDMMQNGQLVF